jgi:hypothetical protein
MFQNFGIEHGHPLFPTLRVLLPHSRLP